MGRKRFILLCFILFYSDAVAASPLPSANIDKKDIIQEAPIQIDANSGIECNKTNKICKAFNAKIVHKDMTLKGSILTVTFDEKEGVQSLKAEGRVFIESGQEYKASAQTGSFDINSGIVILEQAAEAYDLKNNRSLKGDKIILKLNKVANGKMVINKIEVYDNVEIKTIKERALSDKGAYEADKEFITLTGNVRITNKEGQLSGEAAEMDLKTGISRIKSQKGPVKVFLKARSKNEERT